MEVTFSPEYEAFRGDVRKFLAENWTSKPAGERDADAFRRVAIEHGYLYRSVPRIYGGSEQPSDAVRGYIIRREFSRSGAPAEIGGGAINFFVPALLSEGEEWQKREFIPKTLSGEYNWCQGYSEPGAGSDLASVRTRAELRDGEWVINGSKIWNSAGHHATHMFLLVRTETDAPKHQGLSYLLMPMDQPGVTVRPLKQITGETGFNEVFFDDARTKADWIVGKRGSGWQVSRTTLAFERNAVGGAEASAALFDKLMRLARSATLNGAPAIDDPLVRDDLMKIQAMVMAHRLSGLRQLTMPAAAGGEVMAGGSFNKLYGSTIAERIGVLARRLMNDHVLAQPQAKDGRSRWLRQYMNSIAAQIGGGTSNIHRDIIAERRLGLPRDAAGAEHA